MKEEKLIYEMSEFLTYCIGNRLSKEEIPLDQLRNYLVNLLTCMNVGNVGLELRPFHEAFEILKLAERYMKEPPVHDDWIEEPKDLDSYWTWERCVAEAKLQYYKKDDAGMAMRGD